MGARNNAMWVIFMNKLPQRKNIRLRDYDYSQAGYYFVTLCVKDKRCILWDNNVGADIDSPTQLSKIGIVVEHAINHPECI